MTTTTESAPVADTQANEATTEPVSTDGANKEPAATTGPASPKKEPKPNVIKQDFEKDVVYLYQFPRSPKIPSFNAYCLKVETFLRVTGIKYENVENVFKYKSKKGQLPFVELNGEEIPDSVIIIRELSKKFDKDLNAGLTSEQRTQSHAFESMLNNHTSWVVRWWRYNHNEEFMALCDLDIKRVLNSRLPNPFLKIIYNWSFRRNIAKAMGHGIGHHTPQEAIDFGKGDLQVLSNFLGSKDYFFGKEIRQLDVVAFAHLAQFVFTPFEGIKEWMETETPNLLAFVNRIKDKYWPDWDEICKSLEINTHLPKKELTPEQLEEQKKAEEKKAEEERKKEEKRKEKVGAADSADDQTQPGNKPSRSSTSFRLPAIVPLIRSRVSSSTPSASQEEKKKQKEEEKRKKQEEKERKKKEAEEAKAKAKAEAEAKAAEAKANAEAAKATGEAAEKTEGGDAKEAEATKESTEAKEENAEAEKKE